MNNLIGHILKNGIYIIVYSIFLFSFPICAASEQISGFDLNYCNLNFCSRLISDNKVVKSSFFPLYAFERSTLSITKNSKVQRFSAKEGYYDQSRSEIILRNVDELSSGDLIYDLKSGNIRVFRK